VGTGPDKDGQRHAGVPGHAGRAAFIMTGKAAADPVSPERQTALDFA
jgi:hypothetical protein